MPVPGLLCSVDRPARDGGSNSAPGLCFDASRIIEDARHRLMGNARQPGHIGHNDLARILSTGRPDSDAIPCNFGGGMAASTESIPAPRHL